MNSYAYIFYEGIKSNQIYKLNINRSIQTIQF